MQHRIHGTQVDDFTWGYISALFWTTSENEFPEYCYSGEFSISKADADRLTGDALIKIIDDCSKFEEKMTLVCEDMEEDLECGDEQRGHDFALSRNGHGTGFFDRKYASQETLDRLQNLARSFGEVSLYKVNCGCASEDGSDWKCLEDEECLESKISVS